MCEFCERKQIEEMEEELEGIVMNYKSYELKDILTLNRPVMDGINDIASYIAVNGYENSLQFIDEAYYNASDMSLRFLKDKMKVWNIHEFRAFVKGYIMAISANGLLEYYRGRVENNG